jgi:hypothetical protein
MVLLMLRQKHVTFYLTIDSLRKQRTQRRLKPLWINFMLPNQRKETTNFVTPPFQTQSHQESKSKDLPSEISKRNMVVLECSIFQRRSTTFLKRKSGDMISGQSSSMERMSLITMIRILNRSLMHLRKKKRRSSR